MNEFSLINRYFASTTYSRKDVEIGIGDDAAITRVAESQLLATTTDTLLEGVHFPVNTSPEAIAHKALAVNLSDLAAMGAEPCWISLSLSIPRLDEEWLKAFSEKLAYLTEYYSVQLIGGDTVKGPLAITITAQGVVPEESMLTRNGAKAGDWLYATGTLGDASMGLALVNQTAKCEDAGHSTFLKSRLDMPTPRISAGTCLRRLATACIDVSDGLVQDLQHIMNASQVGAILHLDKLPLSEALEQSSTDIDIAYRHALFGGDDYELLFTVSEEFKNTVHTALDNYGIPYTAIGQLTGDKGKIDYRLNDQRYSLKENSETGYSHF